MLFKKELPFPQFIILPQISYHCSTYLHNTTCTTEGKHGIQRKITQKGSKTKRLKKKSERLAQQIIILKDPKKSNDSGKKMAKTKIQKLVSFRQSLLLSPNFSASSQAGGWVRMG